MLGEYVKQVCLATLAVSWIYCSAWHEVWVRGDSWLGIWRSTRS